METTIIGKDQNQMLQTLLASETSENVNFSPSHYGTHEVSHLEADPPLSWHPHTPCMQPCEATVEVFSIDDSYVWQNSSIQEDSMVCLQPLETHPQTDSKFMKTVDKEDHSKEPQSFDRATETYKSIEKTKSSGSIYSQVVTRRKGVTGKRISNNPHRRKCLENDVQPCVSSGDKAGSSASASSKKEANESTKSTIVEEDVSSVIKRFSLGCECQNASCFDGLNPEAVFRHRLNIAELTKEEHDMYLMGLTVACLSDWAHTNRKKERQRLRANYVHQGRSVCLQAFLYLENCTCYQVKRIRKHVMTHGVVPRIHGNHGKRPHNTFALEIYCHATEFLKSFIRGNGGKDFQSRTTPIFLGPDVTRKSVHQGYLEYCRKNGADEKVMSYSTFRHFMKEQFPQIRFRVVDVPGVSREGMSKQPHTPNHNNLSHASVGLNQGAVQTSNKSTSSNHSNHQDVEVLTFAQVLMSGNQQLINSDQEHQSRPEGALATDGNIVVINAVPLESSNSFVSSVNKSATSCSASNDSKFVTLNSSSLCLVNNTNVSSFHPPTLMPLNTFAMLGSNVIPFVVDNKESKDIISNSK